MSFILQNIEKKLRNSVINKPISFIGINIDSDAKKQIYFKNHSISVIVKKLFFNFLIFFSRSLRRKKKNAKNLILFLKFYNYYNTFFFNNKAIFYKKYFLKKNANLFYFNKFFLSTKQVRLKPCLHRLKDRKVAFYKKYI